MSVCQMWPRSKLIVTCEQHSVDGERATYYASSTGHTDKTMYVCIIVYKYIAKKQRHQGKILSNHRAKWVRRTIAATHYDRLPNRNSHNV